MNNKNLIKVAEEILEIYLSPIFQFLLLVLKPIALSNFISNNQSISNGSSACLQRKKNVEIDTNHQIFETLSKFKENAIPLIYLFEKNSMNYYYYLPTS